MFLWRLALLLFATLPVPSNDSFFYDGPVVNLLLHGKYTNPSLALALPISGKEVFCAYPPLYQGVLLGWMALFGTSAASAMTLHVALFGLYVLILFSVLRRLPVPEWAVAVGGLFLFIITFDDRPDSLAHLFGIAAVYAWVRSRPGGGRERKMKATGGVALQTLREVWVRWKGRRHQRRRNPGKCSSGWSGPAGLESGEAFGVRRGPPLSFSGQQAENHWGWHWLMIGLAVLSLATSLQIGTVYCIFVWVATLSGTLFLRERFPLGPMLGLLLIPPFLLGAVIAGFPHLWAGFMEHASQTPSLTGWRLPRFDELLKVGRTAPGILAVALLLPWLLARQCAEGWPAGLDECQIAGLRTVWLLAWASTAAALAVVVASMLLLTANAVFFAVQIQPLAVAGCLTLVGAILEPCRSVAYTVCGAGAAHSDDPSLAGCGAPPLAEQTGAADQCPNPITASVHHPSSIIHHPTSINPPLRHSITPSPHHPTAAAADWERGLVRMFIGLAALGAIRAVGLATWGLVCAHDFGYSATIRLIRADLAECAPGQAVVLSSAYLYEAARHNGINWIHSDWMEKAERGQPPRDLEGLLALKPAKLILTQFDYYRRYEPLLAELKSRAGVSFQVSNAARIPAPDSMKTMRRVVQHISWAPVVVTLKWK